MFQFLKYVTVISVLVFAVQVMPCFANNAGTQSPPPPNTGTQSPPPNTGTQSPPPNAGTQSPPPPSSGISIPLQNPLGNVTIQQFFLKIIDIILIFAMPLIVLFIILAGFKYVTAQGNTEQIKSATTALTWAIIGGVLILGAKVILTIIEGTIQAIR